MVTPVPLAFSGLAINRLGLGRQITTPTLGREGEKAPPFLSAGPPAVKAGIAVSLTGQYQTQGRQALAGLTAWAAEVNRTGGLSAADRPGSGRPVSVIHYDDHSRAEGAERATRRLIETDRVELLFGPYSSGLAQAAAAVAATHNRLLWNQGGASSTIYQAGRRTVGILTPADQYLAALPQLAQSAVLQIKTFAVIRCATGAFPRQVSDGMEEQARARGLELVLRQGFAPTRTDFSGLLDLVETAKPGLLLAVGRIRHDIAFACQLAQRPKDKMPLLVAVAAAPIAQFSDALGREVEGFIGPSQWEGPPDDDAFISERPDSERPDFYGPSAAELMAILRSASQTAGNLAIDYPMVQAYAAGLVAQRCLAEAGTLEDEALWRAAGRLDFSTFYGRFRIDPETGRPVGRAGTIIQWQRGRKTVVWPPEQAQATLLPR